MYDDNKPKIYTTPQPTPLKSSNLKKKLTILNKLKNIESFDLPLNDFKQENMQKFLLEISQNLLYNHTLNKSVLMVYISYFQFTYKEFLDVFISYLQSCIKNNIGKDCLFYVLAYYEMMLNKILGFKSLVKIVNKMRKEEVVRLFMYASEDFRGYYGKDNVEVGEIEDTGNMDEKNMNGRNKNNPEKNNQNTNANDLNNLNNTNNLNEFTGENMNELSNEKMKNIEDTFINNLAGERKNCIVREDMKKIVINFCIDNKEFLDDYLEQVTTILSNYNELEILKEHFTERNYLKVIDVDENEFTFYDTSYEFTGSKDTFQKELNIEYFLSNLHFYTDKPYLIDMLSNIIEDEKKILKEILPHIVKIDLIPVLCRLILNFKMLPQFISFLESNLNEYNLAFLSELSKYKKVPYKRIFIIINDLIKNKEYRKISHLIFNIGRFYLHNTETNAKMRKVIEKVVNLKNEATGFDRIILSNSLSRVFVLKKESFSIDNYLVHLISKSNIKDVEVNISSIIDKNVILLLCMKPWIFNDFNFIIRLISKLDLGVVRNLVYENVFLCLADDKLSYALHYTKFYYKLLLHESTLNRNINKLSNVCKTNITNDHLHLTSNGKVVDNNISTIDSDSNENLQLMSNGKDTSIVENHNNKNIQVTSDGSVAKNNENKGADIIDYKFIDKLLGSKVSNSKKACVLMTYLEDVNDKSNFFEEIDFLVENCCKDIKNYWKNYQVKYNVKKDGFDFDKEIEKMAMM